MADHSKIEWTDSTWNPITGCTLVDEGCRHCYAAHLITSWPAIGNHPSRKGLARKNAAGVSKFTGEVRFNEQWLDQPLRWQKPRKIFVCAHGDLFHESVPDEWIDRVFAVMAMAPQHVFQVLTKRPERAREYFAAREQGDPWAEAADYVADLIGLSDHPAILEPSDMPLPNVWLGTSVSDQASADLRIPALLACPAAVRFVSAEPLLGAVDLTDLQRPAGAGTHHYSALDCDVDVEDDLDFHGATIDWVIVGGESGPHARPMNPQWARDIRDQCLAAGVAFHFKQNGEWVSVSEVAGPGEHYRFPDGRTVRRTGKKLAGRTLDGVTWDQMPGAPA